VRLELAAHPGDHHGQVEGLRHVVVGSPLESFDGVGGVVQRRGEDDRKLRARPCAAHALQHLEPAHVRHQHLEQDEIRIACFDALERVEAVLSLLDGEAVPLEAAGQELAVVGVVVHHQDAGRLGAAGRGPVGRRRSLRRRLRSLVGKRRRAGILLVPKLPVGEVQQPLRRAADLLQVRREIRLAAVLELLLQQLGVAHDLADGRAHLVLEAPHRLLCLAQGLVALAHGQNILPIGS